MGDDKKKVDTKAKAEKKSDNKTNKKEEKKQEVNTKLSKKNLITISIVILIICLIAIAAVLICNPGSSNRNDQVVLNKKESAKIVKNDSSTVSYSNYNNGLVSFEYPTGWTVEIAPTDYIHYAFKVYNPENPTYMFLFDLKQEGALKTEKARQVFAKYYPESPFGKIAVIDPQTTEAYYKVWNHNSDLNNESFNNNFFPHLDNFTVIDTIGTDMMGGDILRATYTDSNGKTAQGLFTAAVKSVGSYYVSESIYNPLGPKVDVWPLNIYNIMIMSAPEDDFINWQSILDHCLSSIQFSDTFISGFNSEEDSLLKTVQANQKVYDQISDMIMSSWEARNNSYDIISQKQSDATLGYERVYDTETGEIYKAYNGFTDDYSGNRYQPITDDMYTQATSGYIEK